MLLWLQLLLLFSISEEHIEKYSFIFVLEDNVNMFISVNSNCFSFQINYCTRISKKMGHFPDRLIDQLNIRRLKTNKEVTNNPHI